MAGISCPQRGSYQSRIAALEQRIEQEKEARGRGKEGAISGAEAAQEEARRAVPGQSDQVGERFPSLGAALLRRIKTGRLLAVCVVSSATLVTLPRLTGGRNAMSSTLAVGLFNSIMFPGIFSLGVAELGCLTGNGSGILNMAIVAGAILLVIRGATADHIWTYHAFFVPTICYL